MDQQQIKHCIDAMAASDLAEMSISHDGWTLHLVRHARPASPAPRPSTATAAAVAAVPTTPVAPAPAEAPASAQLVPAPLYGVVHLQPEPGQPAFVRVGDGVSAGQVLCVIEAMKVFNQVCAERAGTVEAVLVDSGQDVEAGQALLRLR